jgi:nucleoside-diphosphate-sugar epimerase
MSTAIRNVLIAGATGSVGSPILDALLAESTFTVTILTRASSKASFPKGIPVIRVSDAFTVSELTSAFQNQDAVVVALTTSSVTKDGRDGLAFRLIDAAVAAGVKRFIPSEYGANNLDPRGRNLVPVYDIKGAMLEHLIAQSKASNGKLTWTSICCGSWLDWALDPAKSGNFLGIDVKAKTATIYDSGNARFAVTTSVNTGLAVARALKDADATANKQLFLADFITTTRQIIASLEKQTGERFSVVQKASGPEIKALRDKYDSGVFNAMFPILAMTFGADVDVGYDFEAEQEVWNSRLGLPKVELDQVVEEAIELANQTLGNAAHEP